MKLAGITSNGRKTIGKILNVQVQRGERFHDEVTATKNKFRLAPERFRMFSISEGLALMQL